MEPTTVSPGLLILKFDEMDLFPARIAPGCPEVEKDDLALIG
jgi:hypothetical protein